MATFTQSGQNVTVTNEVGIALLQPMDLSIPASMQAGMEAIQFQPPLPLMGIPVMVEVEAQRLHLPRYPPTVAPLLSYIGTTPTAGTTPTPVSNCGVAPVDPKATRQARNLLCYLYSIYGNHILSGQQESPWNQNGTMEMNYIYSLTGKYPAIRGMDYGDSQNWSTRAIPWWQAGGIDMVSYHMGAPGQPIDGWTGAQLTADINAVLTPGTAQYQSFISRLDGSASELAKAQAAGVPIIWRPFHEAGGTWFWWSKQGGSQYVRLWKFMFNYYTNVKGLHNLIWLLPFDGSPNASFWPGKAYVDIAGCRYLWQ